MKVSANLLRITRISILAAGAVRLYSDAVNLPEVEACGSCKPRGGGVPGSSTCYGGMNEGYYPGCHVDNNQCYNDGDWCVSS